MINKIINKLFNIKEKKKDAPAEYIGIALFTEYIDVSGSLILMHPLERPIDPGVIILAFHRFTKDDLIEENDKEVNVLGVLFDRKDVLFYSGIDDYFQEDIFRLKMIEKYAQNLNFIL